MIDIVVLVIDLALITGLVIACLPVLFHLGAKLVHRLFGADTRDR